MISNPIQGTIYNDDGCPEYVKHTHQKVFSKKAFNFQPADCGLSKTREANLLFFALSEEHALERLKRMLEWYIKNNQPPKTVDHHNQHSEHLRGLKVAKVQYWLANWDKVIVVEVPLDQFFKVGWANNDTI